MYFILYFINKIHIIHKLMMQVNNALNRKIFAFINNIQATDIIVYIPLPVRHYVADRYSGLQVVDVSDPNNPAIIGAVDTEHAYG
ncbi:MAG: hypothetical protein KJN62_08675, partial [Deltaproteobacteria bacterium]|nr:hypothetical protein [Deltaproteobacteria bacterium]